ncbi:MAG: ABC transporter permease [Actinomycetota bacterium]
MIVAQAGDIDWSWLNDRWALVGEKFVEHATLTLLAVGIGFLISFPVGVYAYRHRGVYTPVTLVTGMLYTIPSLAAFALLLPFTGLSLLTVVIPLVSYTLLILIRNTVAGFNSVPADTKEAALGMGFTSRELLWRVELPLALPVILTGVRIATVTIIGLVTVAALVGRGGLGYFILLGFDQFRGEALLAGSILSVVFAVTMDALLVLAERAATPWSRRKAIRSL